MIERSVSVGGVSMTMRGLSGSSKQVSSTPFGLSAVVFSMRTCCCPEENTVSPSRRGPVGASEYNARGAVRIMAATIPIDQSGGSVCLWSGTEDTSSV